MKLVIYDIERSEKLIRFGNYEKAVDKIIEAIDTYENKNLVYRSLNLLSLICDKNSAISLKVVKFIKPYINESDSWIRLISLEILYQISLFRPNLLIDLLGKVRNRLYDNDSAIRRLSVRIIGNLILKLYIDQVLLTEVIDEYTEKLMDNDWKVKLHVIKTLKRILNQDYTKIKDLEPLLSMVIVNLRDEDDDVARASAELLKILSTYFLSKEKIFYILLNLLHNETTRVKELIIWLIGEIGKEQSSEIIPIIPKLIKLLEIDDYKIQIKVINALIKIAENNFDQIWSNLINYSSQASNYVIRENLNNALYHLSQKYITKIFPYIFEELENPAQKIRDAVSLVFKRLYEEYKIEIDNEISKILYRLESKYWRARKNTILLLENICFILNIQSIAVWLTIELERLLKNEKDPDVREELIIALRNIKINFKNIDIINKRINQQISNFQEKIDEFQRIPAKFREKLNSYISEFQFNNTEIQLNKMYNNILKKINKFNKELNTFEYKRLANDLLEEWEDTKIQVIDELGIIKSFIKEICDDKKEEYLDQLRGKIQVLLKKIDVLGAKYEYIKEENIDNYITEDNSKFELISNQGLEFYFDQITQIRRNMFRIDVEIRELLINNAEFNEIFKNLLRKWVSTKIKIQIFLNDLDKDIKSMKEDIISQYLQADRKLELTEKTQLINGLNNEFTFQLLQSYIQDLIYEGIEGLKKLNNNFIVLNEKLEYLIKKEEYEKAKNLLDVNSSQIKTYIGEMEKQLDTILGNNINLSKEDNLFNKYIRPYLSTMDASKELLVNKLKSFVSKSYETIYIHQLNYYLNIMNPISIELLSENMGITTDELTEFILKNSNRGKINVRIIKDKVFTERVDDYALTLKEPLVFKNIKTEGNSIFLKFKISNPTHLDLKQFHISLKIPNYLHISKKSMYPKVINFDTLKSGENFKFDYKLKLEREVKRNLADPTADEIRLDIFYKNAFEMSKKIVKKLNLLLP